MTSTTMREAHARSTDPISSHLTLASLGKDTSLKARVLAAAFRLEERHGGAPWNDTQLTEEIERHTRTRQQRNVIARSRDLMTAELVPMGDPPTFQWSSGWFRPAGTFDYDGRPLSHFQLSPEAKVAR